MRLMRLSLAWDRVMATPQASVCDSCCCSFNFSGQVFKRNAATQLGKGCDSCRLGMCDVARESALA